MGRGTRSRSRSPGASSRRRKSGRSDRDDRKTTRRRDRRRSQSRSRSRSRDRRKRGTKRTRDRGAQEERRDGGSHPDEPAVSSPAPVTAAVETKKKKQGVVVAAMEAPLLKAAVSESNGEISASVEETNRIRAILGMKPLNVGNAAVSEKEAAMKKEHMERLAKQAKQAQLAELEERLAKAKRQRELHEKLKGKSLGQSLSEETGMSDAASWVQRSRLRAAQEKLMAEKRAALLDEQEDDVDEAEDEKAAYGADALQGLAVAHGMHEFGEGQTILTLADKGVLDDDEPDILQNVNMVCDARATEMNEEKVKAAKPVYTGEDMATFDPSLRNAGVGGRILQQYDEKKKKAAGMVLDGREHISASDLQRAEAVQARMVAAQALRPGETLTDLSTEKQQINDYYTPSEQIAFKRPNRKRRKKKRKNSKKMSLADELERNPQAGADSRKDRRSRKSGGSKQKAASAARQKQKDADYRSALEKARALAASTYNAEEDDNFLQQSVSRARRWAQKAKEQTAEMSSAAMAEGEEQVARPIADVRADKAVARAAKLREKEEAEKKQAAIDALDEEEGAGSIVFTNTTEFTKRLAARMAGRRATKKEQQKEAEARILERKLDNEARKAKTEAPGEEGEDSAWATVRRSDDMDVDEGPATAAKRKKTTATVTSEPLVSCGMASTLALLARSGELKNKMAFAGRSKDEQMETMKVSKNVTIEYKDEWGRLLTPKEAFRQLSYKFHGRKPGRKKQDKILRKLREDLHVNSGDMDDTPLGIMKAMRKKQQTTQQAHVVLRGGEADRSQIRKK